MMLYEHEGWENASSCERDLLVENRIGELVEGILEAETLLAEGDSSWCLSGDAKECLESMRMELAELEHLVRTGRTRQKAGK